MGSRPRGRDDDLAQVQAELGRWPQLTAALATMLTEVGERVEPRAELDSLLAATMRRTRPSSAPDAAQLAMSCALAGDITAARGWLAVAALEPEPDKGARPVTALPGSIARSLIATRALTNDPVAGLVGGAARGEDQADQFSLFAAYAWGCHALVWGDRIEALDALYETPTQVGRSADDHAGGVVARSLIAAAKAELMMALGRGNHAKGILDTASGDHPMLRVARARLALLTGELECAVTLANALPTGSSDAGSPYHRLEMMVIASVALHRLGHPGGAADRMRRVVNQTATLGALLPLASAPRADIAAIAEDVRSAAALVSSEPFASTPEIYPAAIDLVALTEREQAILEKLATGMPLREIAVASFVSTNTVKSQLRSLYRKLDASSRHSALVAAADLRLLPSA